MPGGTVNVTRSKSTAFELGDSTASREAHDETFRQWEEDGHSCHHSQLLENERLEAAMAGVCASLLVGSTLSDCGLDWTTVRRVASVLGAAGGAAYGTRLWSFEMWYRRHYAREYKREKWELENYEQGEKEEMVGLFAYKGLNRHDAEAVVGTMSASKDFFVGLMMTEELQLREPLARTEARAAAASSCYALAALAPVVAADLLAPFSPLKDSWLFVVVGVLLLGALGARRAFTAMLSVHKHTFESVCLGLVSALGPKLIASLLLS